MPGRASSSMSKSSTHRLIGSRQLSGALLGFTGVSGVGCASRVGELRLKQKNASSKGKLRGVSNGNQRFFHPKLSRQRSHFYKQMISSISSLGTPMPLSYSNGALKQPQKALGCKKKNTKKRGRPLSWRVP